MKPRELRRKVLIRARMRLTATWSDVCILNLSSRGMQLQSARPPARGSFVEIRRGSHVIIGVVAWSSNHRFGVRSQDMIFVDTIAAEPGDAESQRGAVAHIPAERRPACRRAASSTDHSRMLGRAMEFACIGVVVMASAIALYGIAEDALATPLAGVSNALGD